MPTEAFGSLLREFRIAAGLSQEMLAERARLSPGAISALERSARRAPQRQTLGLLAEALRLDQDHRSLLEEAAAAGRHRAPRRHVPARERSVNNLPNLVTSFHGRDREVADLARLIRTRRIVTLLGPGGVGKTRLALEIAQLETEAETFGDGAWFIELASAGAEGMVGSAIARELKVPETLTESTIDAVIAAIGSKVMLLILDNCEHVVAEAAKVGERLCRDCPNVTIITTSREALRIDGECVVRIEPLALEDAKGAGPALDLFIDRLIDADFARFAALSDDDRVWAATICRHLDGIPLALELAAGRARDLSLEQINAGLEYRFALLSSGRRTATPRQSTLRGMLDWSYALLTQAEQRLFARSGLFAEPFTPEAAVEICNDGDRVPVRDALAALIAKSLVDVVEDRAGRLRYRLLETVREYALERLQESGDYDGFASRFALYFKSIARNADDSYGRIPHTLFIASVESDLENFRVALRWTLSERKNVELGAALAGSLGWVYRQTALFAEGTRWCEEALRANQQLDWQTTGRLHMALSFFAFNLGNVKRSLDEAESATRIYRGAGASGELAWSLTQETYCSYLLGSLERAQVAIEEAVAVARQQDDALRLAGALNALALTIPFERAADRLAPLEEAILAYRKAGDESAVVPLANLAEAYFATGEYEAALSRGREIVALTRRNRDSTNLAGALVNVAAYALALEHIDEAQRSAHEALTLVQSIGNSLNAMCALQHLGSVAARRGDFERAARLQGASDRLYADFGLSREFTEQLLHDRTFAKITAALDEEQASKHARDGAMLAFERAVEEALEVR